MRKTVLAIIALLCALVALCGFSKDEMVRVHIRANSNSEYDQRIKEVVSEEIYSYIFEKYGDNFNISLEELALELEGKANEVLSMLCPDMKAVATPSQGYFPAKHYKEKVYKSGIYDSVTVYIGEGKGDNWWCALYPSLTYGLTEDKSVVYKSRILEQIKTWKENYEVKIG